MSDLVKANPKSIFAVKEDHRYDRSSDGEYGGPSSTEIYYKPTDQIEPGTRFLYVDERTWKFVEAGKKVRLTDAHSLVLEKQIQTTEQKLNELLAEQERLKNELYQSRASLC